MAETSGEEMKLSTFYKLYANTPLDKRFKILNVKEGGLKSLETVYKEVQRLDESMQPKKIEMQRLIDLARPFLRKQKGRNRDG